MGLFNYSKPGPGIDKNAPKKKGVFLYFEILFRKIGKLCQANMLYFICSIPMLAVLFFVSTPIISQFVGSLGTADPNLPIEMIAKYTTAFVVFYMFTMLILTGSGPASAAFAYITRCFTREEHCWMWSDFFGKFKENFKQGLIIAIVDIFVINMGFFSLGFYWNYYNQKGQIIWFFLMCVMLIFMLLYVSMHYYIYQLMVTFENKTKDLYKNALILALSTMPVNIIFTVLAVAVCVLVFLTFEPIFTVLVSFIILIGLLRFPFEFYAASTIKKKIIDNMPQEDKKEEFEYYKEIEETDGSEN